MDHLVIQEYEPGIRRDRITNIIILNEAINQGIQAGAE
jgi:hypothetical protein